MQQSRAREHYWLERVKESKSKRLIFVCGDDHLISFSKLLEQAGYLVEVKSKNWGAGWELMEGD
jgi:hypothetical protein